MYEPSHSGGDSLKKTSYILSLIVVLLLLSSLSFDSFADSQGDVYVIPINGEINRATRNYVRDIVSDLNNMENVEAIIFEIDTYGGLIDEAVNIKDIIVSTNIPTITFVNNKAISAGVLLTIAGEKVVMSPNATIGSAEPIPNTEKNLSFWRSVLRDTAQYRGRDYRVIEAMADKDIVVDNINKSGKLVNLTSPEALELGISDYTSDNYVDILEHFNYSSDSVIVKTEGLQIKLSKYISSPYLSSILLTIAFVGMVVEILTPGFGLGGTISIIGFGLYFGGNILAGNSHWTSLVLFVTGLLLFVVEGIVPGFGLPGISGMVFVLVGVILAMDSLGVALLSLSVAVIITTIVTVVLLKLGFRSKIFDHIILSTEHRSEKGYLSSDSEYEYLNKKGVALTNLRPTGFIEIDGVKIDALSDEGFIPKDENIQVIRVEGSKIFVRRI